MPKSGSYSYPSVSGKMANPYSRQQLWSGYDDNVALVDIYGYLATISQPHSKGHLGEIHSVTFDAGSITNGTKLWMIQTPVTGSAGSPLCHLQFSVTTGGLAKTEFWEGAVVNGTSSGSQLAVNNIRRKSDGDTTMLWFSSPTLTSSGSLLEVSYAGSTGGLLGGRGAASAKSFLQEWILNSNTNYIIKVTTLTTNVNVSMTSFYYTV